MPKGLTGQRRPADAIGLAVMGGRIATGEIEETTADPKRGRKVAKKKGAAARAKAFTPRERFEIASVAVFARWKKT